MEALGAILIVVGLVLIVTTYTGTTGMLLDTLLS
jgi:hypothetical protein